MNERLEQIQAALSRLKTKTLLFRSALALILFAAGLLLILILTGLSQRIGRGSAAFGLIFWIYAAAGIAGIIFWLRRNWLDIDKTALLCQQKFPELGDGLISLIQLGRMLASGKPDFSITLFEKHLEQVEEKLSRVNLSQVAQARRLKIPAAVCSGLALIWALLIFFYPGYATTIMNALALKSLHPGRAGQMARVSRPLELYDFTLDYQYPPYSGLAPKKVEAGDGSISALKGTVVALAAKIPVKVEKVWIQFSVGGKIDAALKANELSVRMLILDSGQYRFEALDKNDRLWTEPSFHQIAAIPDNTPEVTLFEPSQDMVVSLDQKLKLKFRSRDDYGLDSFSLVFNSRGKEKRILINKFSPPELEAEREYDWVLSEHNLMPGEKVAYYIEARDNNNATGPGIGKSQVRYIEVFSPLKRHQEILAQEQELFEALILLLGKNIDARLAIEPAVKFWERETGLIKDFESLKTLVEKLKPEVDKDEYSTAFIKDAVSQAERRYRGMLAERKSSFAAKDQAAASRQREKAVPVLEQDVLFWDNQLKKQRMDFLLALGDKLKESEEQLRRLMEEYKRTGDPELLKEIEARLEEIKAAYQEFLTRMSEMSQTQVDEFVNLDALQAKAAGDVMQKLEQFRQSVHDRDIGNAMQDAEDFLTGLDQMLSDLKQGSEQMGQTISAQLMAQMEQNLDELKRLREDQEQLIRGTEPIYQSQFQDQERAASEIEKQNKDMEAELDKLSQEMSSQLDDINKLQLDRSKGQEQAGEFYRNRSSMSSFFWQMQQEISNARNELEQKKLQEARQRMDTLAEELVRAKFQGSKVCQGSSGGAASARAFSLKSDLSIARAKALSSRLDELSRLQKTTLTPAQMQTLKMLSQQQAGLRGRLENLQREMGEVFNQMPVYPEKVPGLLSSAELKMRDAEGELELSNPELGLMAQKEAKYWLEQAEKMLEQFKQKVRQNSQGGVASLPLGANSSPSTGQNQEGGLGFKQKDFEIPGRETNKNPVELRKQILKAEREGSPKDYEELNRDYYKRLVQ